MQTSGKAINSVCRTLYPLRSKLPLGISCKGYAKLRHVSTASITKSLSVSERLSQRSSTPRKRHQIEHLALQHSTWPNDSCILPLPSGDQLSYARVGYSKDRGPVWVLFHGTPGCRLEAKGIIDYAENHGIRVVAIDRPGYGYSSMHKRGMLRFIEDVKHLLDYLGVQEFSVYAVSGGGPYALAAAYYFAKSRLLKTLILCGVTHPNFEQTAVRITWRIGRWCAAWLPIWPLDVDFESLLRCDIRKAKGDPKKEQRLRLEMDEVGRQGSKGYNNDFRLAGRPWGFDLQDIDANPILWYHGALDLNTSADAARATADMVNRHRQVVDFREIPGLDHYTLQSKVVREGLVWLKK